MNQYTRFAILIIFAAAAIYFLPKSLSPRPNQNAVSDFHSCAEAGNPITESFPAQCRTPDGQVFTEDLSENPEVVVTKPVSGQVVTSPMTVTGRAKGFWFFEANIPVTLKDQNGKVFAKKGAQAQGDWMTEDYVDFSTSLEFANPETEYGVLLIEKDNPSGDPQFDASFAIPVKFR